MRLVTYGAACSLDGFITARDGAIDWLHFSPDVSTIMTEYWSRTDTILFGRKTWDAAVAMGGGGGGGMGAVKSVLFSRTLTKSPHPDIELVSDDAGGYVNTLKRKKGKGICVMSGGDLARSLFAAGVIDEVGANVHPVLLGAGTPLFLDSGTRANLVLKECRKLPGGCVYVTYRVKKKR